MSDLSVRETEAPSAARALPPAMPRPRPRSRRKSELPVALLFLLPSALILGSFGFFPLLYAFYVSLHRWTLIRGPFVGLGNYAEAVREPDFWQALQVTVHYVLGTVPITLVLGFLIATLLNRRLAGLAIYRLLFFTPYIVSPVAAAAVWGWIYHPNYGLANAVLQALHLPSRQWLHEPQGVIALLGGMLGIDVPSWAAGPSVALTAVMTVSVWHGLGFAVVILLAGLTAIPSEVTEAARLDGASGWPMLRYVTVPLLSPTLFFLLIVFTIRAFQTFNQIYILTPDGGPQFTTRNITMYIFSSFYQNTSRLGYGYGAAVAFILFGLILLLTVLQFKLLGERVHY
jgi:multiple sugar transport system permease protein